MPMSTDRDVAQEWILNHGDAGIEGVVAKRLDQPYRSKGGIWQKVRTRRTAEAIVGGVLGTLERPDVVVGHCDSAGRLRISGCTSPLSAQARRGGGRSGAVLRPTSLARRDPIESVRSTAAAGGVQAGDSDSRR